MFKLKNILSEHKITWVKPDMASEVGEYFENPYTKKAFSKNGYKFNTKEALLKFLSTGQLVTIEKSELLTHFDNLTLSNFEHELKNEKYAESYKNMEKALEQSNIKLPAPIIIKFGEMYYGFAGNRRMNLAWSKNVPLEVWLIQS